MRTYPVRTSILALWGRRLAMFGLAAAVAGVVLARLGRIAPVQGLILIGAGAALSALALGLALAAYREIWRTGAVGLRRANVAALLALLNLAVPAWQIVRAYSLPAINDVSTDLKEPPAFSRARSALEARAGHVPPEPSEETRQLQEQAYSDLEPLTLELNPEEAYGLVIEALNGLKWTIVDRSPPSGRTGIGRVDAIQRTPILRFSDDVTIRIRPLANVTRIDIRSASRIGRHDLGANAARIRTLIVAIQALTSN
ncbi:MAG TPA: DUF1499 domain-containing protein [Beijerinckiaceae bacterium]|nr:DUF1499 domain-containing protein [Beijerinckiaceae bacterium]